MFQTTKVSFPYLQNMDDSVYFMDIWISVTFEINDHWHCISQQNKVFHYFCCSKIHVQVMIGVTPSTHWVRFWSMPSSSFWCFLTHLSLWMCHSSFCHHLHGSCYLHLRDLLKGTCNCFRKHPRWSHLKISHPNTWEIYFFPNNVLFWV